MAISVGDAVLKITGDTKDLDRSMSGLKGRVKNSMAGISKQVKVAGAAFTALGAAGLKLAGDSRKLNAQFSQTAIGLGLTAKEVRGLALETTNVTFPLKSVANTFELLTRAGIEDQQMLMDSATAFDTLADATGSTAEEMAELLLPAFKLFGEALPTTAAELDRFTFLTKTTTVDLQDFGTMLTRMAPEMDTLNLSMDDAVLTLAALSEKGIEGSAATLALRTAITKAAREGTTLNEVMGITPEIIARLTAEMEGATGITQEYADAANTQFGVMDKLKQKWSELALRAGSFLEPMEPILAGITVLGPVMILLSTSVGANTVAWVANTIAQIASKVAMVASVAITTALTAAQWLLNAALTANPFAIVLVAATAVAVYFAGDWLLGMLAGKQAADDMGLSIAELREQMDQLGKSSEQNDLEERARGLQRAVEEVAATVALLESGLTAAAFEPGEGALAFTERMIVLKGRVADAKAELNSLQANLNGVNKKLEELGGAAVDVADSVLTTADSVVTAAERITTSFRAVVSEGLDPIAEGVALFKQQIEEVGLFVGLSFSDRFNDLVDAGLSFAEAMALVGEEILDWRMDLIRVMADDIEGGNEALARMLRLGFSIEKMWDVLQAGTIAWKETIEDAIDPLTVVENKFKDINEQVALLQSKLGSITLFQAKEFAGGPFIPFDPSDPGGFDVDKTVAAIEEANRRVREGGVDRSGNPLPEFAGGVNNFRGGLAIVGERGRELLNLPRGTSVTPLAAEVLSGAQGGNVTSNGDFRSMFSELFSGLADDIAEKLARVLRENPGQVTVGVGMIDEALGSSLEFAEQMRTS